MKFKLQRSINNVYYHRLIMLDYILILTEIFLELNLKSEH